MTLVQGNLIRIIDEKCLVKNGVARRAGMSVQTFPNILTGRKVIRADMIPSLAAALDVPIPELFREVRKEE